MSDERLIELMTEVRDLVKEQRDDAREHMAKMTEFAEEQRQRTGLVTVLVRIVLAIIIVYVIYVVIALLLVGVGL